MDEARAGPLRDTLAIAWLMSDYNPADYEWCPNCKAQRVVMVNTSWAECTNPYCKRPYAIMGIWTEDYA